MKLKKNVLVTLFVVAGLAGPPMPVRSRISQLYDGTSNSPAVTVNYTNPDGTGSNSGQTYADPQVMPGTTTPLYYCIDLWHDNNLGSTYTITPVSSISFANTSTFSDVDKRLAWLVNQPQNTVDQRAAVQLAMWYTIDNKGFSYTGGDSTLRTDYNALIGFAGYNPTATYGAQFWSRDPRSREHALPGSDQQRRPRAEQSHPRGRRTGGDGGIPRRPESPSARSRPPDPSRVRHESGRAADHRGPARRP